jgi:hypothetical protein
MIKKFKLFENIENKLSIQFSDNFIEKYFDNNFLMSVREIIELWPNYIWRHVDDDEYIKDLIEDEIDSCSIDNFGEYDYIDYLKNNMTDNKEEKIIKLYNNIDDDEQEYYDSDMLDKLTEDQLKDIIEDDDENEEFIKYIVNNRYDGCDAEDVIKDIYGSNWILDHGTQIYDILRYYVEDSKIIDDWKNDTDKREKVEEEICRDVYLQKKLLKKKKSNVFLLAKLFIKDNNTNISDEYDFQKAYITAYIKKNISNKSNDILRAEALKYLYDNFELDNDIEEEYKEDMWMIGIDKFNI